MAKNLTAKIYMVGSTAGVEVEIKDKATTKGSKKANKMATKKVILNSVSGEARPGEILATMGPSGSGKTSLMSVLSGRSAYQEGTISVNGKVLDKHRMKQFMSQVAFVKQQDVFFETLTVRDQLTYTAKLRFPDCSKKGRSERIQKEVDRIIDMLHLTKVADNQIKMCSGGEKKRVNIATELLTDPMVIMLDEPTSGLDSASASSLLNVLKDLAKNHGKTIITTIHQPSSATFLNTFDKLLMISDGSVVYFGTPSDSLDHLAAYGYACPHGYNGADHWMDLLVTPSSNHNEGDGVSAKLVLQKSWDDEAIATRIDSAVELEVQPENITTNNYVLKSLKVSKYTTSWFTQFVTLTSRALKKSKLTLLSPITIGQTIGLSVIVGFVFFDLGETEKDAYNYYSYFYVSMISWILFAMNQAIFTFPQDRLVVNKERATASYHLSAYFTAITVADLPLTLLMQFLYMAISYWMVAWAKGWDAVLNFIYVLGITVLAVLAGQALGYLVGAIFDDTRYGFTVYTVMTSLLLLLGGFFNPHIAPWLNWARYLSPFHYASNAAMQLVFVDDIPCDGSGALCAPGEKYFPAERFLEEEICATDPLWLNLTMLFVFLTVPRIFAYVVLRYKKPSERE